MKIYILFADYEVSGHRHDGIMLLVQGRGGPNSRASFFLACNDTRTDAIAANTIEPSPRLKILDRQLKPALCSSSPDHGVIQTWSIFEIGDDDERKRLN